MMATQTDTGAARMFLQETCAMVGDAVGTSRCRSAGSAGELDTGRSHYRKWPQSMTQPLSNM